MLLITFLSLVINVKRMGELFSGSEVISVLYKVRLKYSISNVQLYHQTRSGSRDAATSKMECFVIIVNGWKPLTIIRKHSISILDVAAALDPALTSRIAAYLFSINFVQCTHLSGIMFDARFVCTIRWLYLADLASFPMNLVSLTQRSVRKLLGQNTSVFWCQIEVSLYLLNRNLY